MPGEILKKRREELKKDLKDIAHTLKIRYDYLKAIEEDDFGKLPVPVYTRGYIRGYANFLNIDPEPIIKAFNEKISPPVIEKPAVSAESEQTKKTMSRYFIIVIIISVIAASYILFTTLPRKTEVIPQKAEPPKSPVASTPSVQQLQPEQPSKTVRKEIVLPEKKEPLREHTLEISASDTTWLLIKIDNTETKEMLLKKGESAKLLAKERFSIKIGNAGGTKIIFDGKDTGIQGEKGQVINLDLPPEKNVNTSQPQAE